MPRIDNIDSFLSELSKMFEKSKSNSGPSSLYLTMKRWDGRTKPIPKPNARPPKRKEGEKPVQKQSEPTEYKCLVRAALGDKKISIAVAPKDMNRFVLAHSSLIRGNVTGLKKRSNKPGTPKSKATQ